MKDDLLVELFEGAEEFGRWIEKHPDAAGVWVKIAKRGTGVTSISFDEALEVALCYGWIDTMNHRLDETFYLQKFVPRKPKGTWSARNKVIAERLIADGRMQPSGQAQIDAAKADGRWDAN